MEIYEITTDEGVVLCYECNGTYFCLYEENEAQFNHKDIKNIERISQ